MSRNTPGATRAVTTMLFLGAALAAVVSTGCGPSDDDEESPSPSPTPVTFTYVQEEIFAKSCNFSTCHAGPSGGADLVLSESKAYDQLVNTPSTQKPEMKRVVPGDPDSSYLMWKLEGREGIVEDPMPEGGQLEPARLEAVRAWIEAGAKQD